MKPDESRKSPTTDGASAQAATAAATPQVSDAAATGRRAPRPLLPPRRRLCQLLPLLLPPPLVPLL